jgi:hypothetical protein
LGAEQHIKAAHPAEDFTPKAHVCANFFPDFGRRLGQTAAAVARDPAELPTEMGRADICPRRFNPPADGRHIVVLKKSHRPFEPCRCSFGAVVQER